MLNSYSWIKLGSTLRSRWAEFSATSWLTSRSYSQKYLKNYREGCLVIKIKTVGITIELKRKYLLYFSFKGFLLKYSRAKLSNLHHQLFDNGSNRFQILLIPCPASSVHLHPTHTTESFLCPVPMPPAPWRHMFHIYWAEQAAA